MRVKLGGVKETTTFTEEETVELASLEKRLEAAVHARESFEVELEEEQELDELDIEIRKKLQYTNYIA